MTTLGKISEINDNISKAQKKTIRDLHVFVFEEEGDRGNRKRLRNFAGFTFNVDSDDFKKKVEWAERQFSLGALIAMCNVLMIDYDGSIKEIVRRMGEHLTNLPLLRTHGEEDSDLSDEEADATILHNSDDAIENRREEVNTPSNLNLPVPTQAATSVHANMRQNNLSMSFRDMEDTIRSYDGADGYAIETWISEFEEAAALLGLTDLQKLLFAKKCLTGIAKLFVQGERHMNSWSKLRKSLIDEFSSRINSAELHGILVARKKRPEETLQEYFLTMKEIASRGSIEPEAIIKYIVDGIPGDPNIKLTLYEAKSLNELKGKLNIYERVQRDMPPLARKPEAARKETFKKTTLRTTTKEKMGPPRCYNCNETGHLMNACSKPKRDKGSCYTCGGKDHLRRNCPKRTLSSGGSSTNVTTHLVELDSNIIPCYTVDIVLDIGRVTAILDTGSPISLLSQSMVPPEIPITPYNDIKKFEGVNKSQIAILGNLKLKLMVSGCEAFINFFIVPDTTMNYQCLLGRDFIAHDRLDVTIGKTVDIREKNRSETEISFVSEILRIDVVEEKNKLEGVIINQNLDWKVQEKVQSILKDDYVLPERPAVPATELEMELVLKTNHTPFCYNPRRLSFAEKEAVTKIIQDLLSRKIIRTSNSPYCSPIVLIRKKTGQYRMAVDYKDLNILTVRDSFPIPRCSIFFNI